MSAGLYAASRPLSVEPGESTAAEFGAWLEEHSATEPELIVAFFERATDRPSVSWSEL
jgi:hypothetical protein